MSGGGVSWRMQRVERDDVRYSDICNSAVAAAAAVSRSAARVRRLSDARGICRRSAKSRSFLSRAVFTTGRGRRRDTAAITPAVIT